jgi:hypothetical protein
MGGAVNRKRSSRGERRAPLRILAHCHIPVLALLRPGEHELKGATKSIDAANPQLLLDAVA